MNNTICYADLALVMRYYPMDTVRDVDPALQINNYPMIGKEELKEKEKLPLQVADRKKVCVCRPLSFVLP